MLTVCILNIKNILLANFTVIANVFIMLLRFICKFECIQHWYWFKCI